VLSKSIGGRHATSSEERRAAEYTQSELKNMRLSQADLISFRGAVFAWMPWSVALSLAAWGMLIGLLLGRVGALVAAVLYLYAAWIVFTELYPTLGSTTGYPVRRWLWRGDSQNVIGVVAAEGQVERHAVLVAYLDSPRESFLWHNARRRRFVRWLRPALFVSLLISAASYSLAAVAGSIWPYFVAFLMLFPQVGALFVCIRGERARVSPGANNNAAGVGTLLALAERLQKTPLKHTEVWLLATGCRETGGDGMRSFLESNGTELDSAIFVALEGVGVGDQLLFLTGEGALHQTQFAPDALALAGKAADRCRQNGLQVRAERHRGTATEMGLLTRSGFKGVTISNWPADMPGIAGRRQGNDSFGKIQVSALSLAHVFVWALLEEIDRIW
jgi:hypothetical protein